MLIENRKISYSILVSGRPFVVLSRPEAVRAVVSDIRSSIPDAVVTVLENSIADVSEAYTLLTNDQCVEGSRDPDSVE